MKIKISKTEWEKLNKTAQAVSAQPTTSLDMPGFVNQSSFDRYKIINQNLDALVASGDITENTREAISSFLFKSHKYRL